MRIGEEIAQTESLVHREKKKYAYLWESKDYREEMVRVHAPVGWWKTADELCNAQTLKKMDRAEHAYDERMRNALGYISSFNENTVIREIIPARAIDSLIWSLYRHGGYYEYEYEGVGDTKLVKEMIWRRWTVRAMEDALEARGIKRSRGYVQKLFKQWENEGMNGSKETPKELTELEHGPVVRYYQTLHLYNQAQNDEVKRRLERYLELRKKELEKWMTQRLLYIGADRVNTIITKAASKSYVSRD